MHYKIKSIFIMCLLSTSIANALEWPLSEKKLLNDVNETRTRLEQKTGFCMDLRKRALPKIQSDWLYSLSEKRRKGVLFIVSMIVFDRCTSQERVNHSISVMRYTAETDTKKVLNEWIKLSNYRNQKEIFDEFSDIPPNKITDLSLKPELYYPFEPMGSEKLIVPEIK